MNGMSRLYCCFLALGTQCLAAQPIDFAHQVAPLLKQHCGRCHTGDNAEGGLSMNDRGRMLAAGVIHLTDVEASELWQRVTSDDAELRMPPPDARPLNPDELKILREWLEGGATWQDGFGFAVVSYEPPLKPRRPSLPEPIGDRTNPIDRILDHDLREKGIPLPEVVGDAQFARRAYFDLIGVPPTIEELDAFLADPAADKREQLAERLLANREAFATHWLTFWNDLLRNAYDGTGYIDGGRSQITTWLYQALLENKSYDDFVRDLIAPSEESAGFIQGIQWRGDVNASQKRELQFAQSVSQVFLGINMKCASCHDSFIDRWTLDATYGLAAIYSEIPLELHRCDKPQGKLARAAWIFPELGTVDPHAPPAARLRQLAVLMTHPENGRLTRTVVNRVWHRLMGRGIVHPVDAMEFEPFQADLLDWLAVYLADQQYDLQRLLRLIVTSHAYQSSMASEAEQVAGTEFVYRGPLPRRLTIEQLMDAVWQITGTHPQPDDSMFRGGGGHPHGQLRAVLMAMKRAGIPANLDSVAPPPDGAEPVDDMTMWRTQWGSRPIRAALTHLDWFQMSLGRPNREQIVTSRPDQLTTLEAITLANDERLAATLAAGAKNLIERYDAAADQIVDYVFRSALSRPPTPAELRLSLDGLPAEDEGESLPLHIEDFLWSVVMLPEFQTVQ